MAFHKQFGRGHRAPPRLGNHFRKMIDRVSHRDGSLEPEITDLQQASTDWIEDHPQGAGFESTSTGPLTLDTNYSSPSGTAEQQYRPTDLCLGEEYNSNFWSTSTAQLVGDLVPDCSSQCDLFLQAEDVENQPFGDLRVQSPNNDWCKGQMHQKATLTASISFLDAYQNVEDPKHIRYRMTSILYQQKGVFSHPKSSSNRCSLILRNSLIKKGAQQASVPPHVYLWLNIPETRGMVQSRHRI